MSHHVRRSVSPWWARVAAAAGLVALVLGWRLPWVGADVCGDRRLVELFDTVGHWDLADTTIVAASGAVLVFALVIVLARALWWPVPVVGALLALAAAAGATVAAVTIDDSCFWDDGLGGGGSTFGPSIGVVFVLAACLLTAVAAGAARLPRR